MTEQGLKKLIVIEGGGSTCRGLTYDLIQNRATTPVILNNHPCNLYRDRDLTLKSLRVMLATLDAGKGSLTLCLPGASHTDNVIWLKDHLKVDGYDTVHVATDAIAALLGAFETLENGQGIFIGGTGSVALGYAQGTLWRHGTPETEKACGPWIARKAWATRLYDPELNHIFESSGDLTHAAPHAVAAFAPAIFEAASQGNQIAESILQEAARSATAHMTRMQDFGITRFILCGSVACALQSRIGITTESPRGTGLDGALKLALSVYKNPETLSLFTNLRRIEDEEQKQKAVNQ